MEDYVHRAGRTGRAGNKGTCVTFITPEQERYSVDIYRALKASNATIPKDLEELANGEYEIAVIRTTLHFCRLFGQIEDWQGSSSWVWLWWQRPR